MILDGNARRDEGHHKGQICMWNIHMLAIQGCDMFLGCKVCVKLKCMRVSQKAGGGLIKYFKILGLLGTVKVIICIDL